MGADKRVWLIVLLWCILISEHCRADISQFRTDNNAVLYKIEKEYGKNRLAVMGKSKPEELDSWAFALRWDRIGAGRMRRRGILRELVSPFSLSVRSTAYRETCGLTPDFSLEPSGSLGGAVCIGPQDWSAGFGIAGHPEYSYLYFCGTLESRLYRMESFLLSCAANSEGKEDLTMEPPVFSHSLPFYIAGAKFDAEEGFCFSGLLLSAVLSETGSPGALLRWYTQYGEKGAEGLCGRLLIRNSTAFYASIRGTVPEEEADMHLRLEYCSRNSELHMEASLCREKEAPVPDLYIQTSRAVLAGLGISSAPFKGGLEVRFCQKVEKTGEVLFQRTYQTEFAYSGVHMDLKLSAGRQECSSSIPSVYADAAIKISTGVFIGEMKFRTSGKYSFRLDCGRKGNVTRRGYISWELKGPIREVYLSSLGIGWRIEV